jgi:Phytanoyl-CoA dioxygenase (PhyH)
MTGKPQRAQSGRVRQSLETRPGSADGEAASALAAADELADAGRCLDAIDLLTEANRRTRSADIERRLVDLRHAAYEELDRSPTDSPWPDDAPRPRDGEAPLPAIEPGELTPELVRHRILSYGCAYVPGLLARERVDQLVEGIDRAFAGCTAQSSEDEEPDTAPWYVRFQPGGEGARKIANTREWVHEGGGVWTAESPRVMFDFLESLDEVGLRSLIKSYLGERPAMSLDKGTLRRVPVLGGADWHQDGAFLGDGIRTVNLWLTLSHCGDDAPGLDLVPRRLEHLAETGTHGAWFDWSVAPDVVEQTADGVSVLRPIFEPGDALLFDELFLHRTATEETMTRERYAIETWFFAPSLYPGNYPPFVW